MTFDNLLDEYGDYLDMIRFASKDGYLRYMNNIYTRLHGAQRLLDKIANESDSSKQLNYCIQLIERISSEKANEKDKIRKNDLGNWHSGAMKFAEFIHNKDHVISHSYSAHSSIHAMWKKMGSPCETPIVPPDRGPDQETVHIRYAKDVHDEEKVPGLCCFLEEEYGAILRFARELFSNCFPNFPERIQVELRKECPTKIYINSDEYVAKKINELIKEKKPINAEETAKILRHRDRIRGKFIHSEGPLIVIYFNQFPNSCWEEYTAYMVKTLAHEFAHYLEYTYCMQHGAKSFQDERVSEAIADFFGVLYSIKRSERGISVYDLQVAKKRYNAWKEHFGSGWPYAYALCFYKTNGDEMAFSDDFLEYIRFGCIKKLVEVFLSTLDSDSAYKKLVSN